MIKLNQKLKKVSKTDTTQPQYLMLLVSTCMHPFHNSAPKRKILEFGAFTSAGCQLKVILTQATPPFDSCLGVMPPLSQ